jgi:hypothetical protein
MTTKPKRQETTTYDAAARRQSVRKGRERGVWVFVPATELRGAGIDPYDPAPLYRFWQTASNSIMIRFYESAEARNRRTDLDRCRCAACAIEAQLAANTDAAADAAAWTKEGSWHLPDAGVADTENWTADVVKITHDYRPHRY